VRVGLYARISEDLGGQAMGVARQEQDTRTLAERRGWTVGGVYTDNDVSAFKAKVKRPEFERLLTDLEVGVLDGLVVYDLDRFARQPVDLERALRIFDARPGLGFATVQSDLDLSTSDGRTMARVMVAFANKSSMDTARRVRRKHLELAQKGIPVGGHRPFGFKRDKVTLEPSEVALIKEAAADVLAGVGVHTICRRWNEAGINTTAGNPWRRTVLKNLLMNPRIAGYRVYQGKIAVDPEGNPVRAVYPAILDLETWEAVCAALTDPSRSSKFAHVGGRKYLLSGIVRCAACSAALTGGANKADNTFTYNCKPVTAGGCGSVAITGPRLDDLITRLVIEYLSTRTIETAAGEWSGEAELEDLNNRIADLMDAYTAGQLSGPVVFPAVSKLERQITDLRESRSAWVRSQRGR
jgi:site-specific DNA recombinase